MAAEEFFDWQDRRTQPRRAAPPIVYPAPIARSADDAIDVQEHQASTTIVEQIREGLLKLMRRE